MTSPSLFLLPAYVAGVCVASWAGDVAGWVAGGALIALGAVAAAAARRSAPASPARAVRTAVVVAAMAAAGGVLNAGHARLEALGSPLRALGADLLARAAPVTIEGRLRADAEPADYGARLLVDVDRVTDGGRVTHARGIVAVTVSGDRVGDRLAEWRAGRPVRMPVTVRGAQRFQNPGLDDPSVALALRGISWLAAAKSALLVDVTGRGSMVDELTASARAHARRSVRQAFARWGPPAGRDLQAGVVVAILIGDRSGLPPEVTDRLQRAGTFHVIAISGGNIAILTALIAWSLRWLGAGPRPAAAVTLLAIGSYGLVASGSPSVSRATLVAVIYLAGLLFDLRPGGFAVLRAAVLALLVWAPLALFDAGFLLTVVATVAVMGWHLVLTAGRTPPRRGDGAARRVAGAAAGIVAATLAVDIALLPVGASVFSQVTIAGVVLNLLAIPLMTITQVAGLAIVLPGPAIETVSRLATTVASGAVGILLDSARLVDRVPALTWRVPPPPVVAVVAYYATWGAWLVARRAGRPRCSHAALVLAGLTAVWIALAPLGWPSSAVGLPRWPARHDAGRGVLAAVFLDVGQGDATILRFPSGRAWLVDAGGLPGSSTFDIGARIVVPAAWAVGVRSIEVLAITHPDPDHAGGAPAAIADLRPREVWEGVPVAGHPLLSRIRAVASRHGSLWKRVERGVRLSVDGAAVSVLHPPRPEWERRRARNDDSLTLLVDYGRVRVILPGDIGTGVERELLGDIGHARVHVTVLKVAHHGSAGSSGAAFLAAARPALAVVSAGRFNRFGHPSPAALARLRASGAHVVGTDGSGALALLTDGETVYLFAWNGSRWRLIWRGDR